MNILLGSLALKVGPYCASFLIKRILWVGGENLTQRGTGWVSTSRIICSPPAVQGSIGTLAGEEEDEDDEMLLTILKDEENDA